jgi:hypothetical protein
LRQNNARHSPTDGWHYDVKTPTYVGFCLKILKTRLLTLQASKHTNYCCNRSVHKLCWQCLFQSCWNKFWEEQAANLALSKMLQGRSMIESNNAYSHMCKAYFKHFSLENLVNHLASSLGTRAFINSNLLSSIFQCRACHMQVVVVQYWGVRRCTQNCAWCTQ